MNIEDENMEWEKEASQLAGFSRSTPYCVPANYFEELSDRIKASVFINELGQQKHNSFSVPSNYFEELEANIQARIITEQIKSLIPDGGFKTPQNYFETLNAEILKKTSTLKPERKVFRLWNKDVIKYAAAACFVALAASGIYLNDRSTAREIRSTELASEQMLYDIDESVIVEHLQEVQNVSNTSVSDQEMENYILNHYSSNELSTNL